MSGNCIQCQAPIEAHYKACPICGEPISDFVRQSLQGPIDGKYRIISRLGRGGMGEVYKVLHVHLNAPRVIKLMRPNIASDLEALERFSREARLATRINHPHVATLHDFATLPDGSFYMVWEYIEGKSLAQLIQQRGRISPRYATLIAIQALHGLDAIHRAGIVHRDVSPDNIMLAVDEHGEERVKIIDLGIAKGDDAGGHKTQTGIFVGKWRYCSPEHLGLLEEGEHIDGRADIYSFGIVLYEMLTGTPPFVAEGPQQYYMQHARETPKPLLIVNPSIADAPELEALIFRALEKDRRKRFATARDFANALQAILPQLPDDAAESQPTMALRVELPTERLTPPPIGQTQRGSARGTSSASAPQFAAQAAQTQRGTAAVEPSPASVPKFAAPPTVIERKPSGGNSKIWIVAAAVVVLLVAGVTVGLKLAGKRDVAPEIAASANSDPGKAIAPAQVIPTSTVGTGASATIDVVPPLATETTATVDTTQTAAVEPRAPKRAPVAPKRAEPPAPRIEEPAAPKASEPLRVAKTGRRGGPGTLTAAPEYSDASFRAGVIPDYEVLTKGNGVNWLWTAPGFRFVQHKIRIGAFRNVTAYDSPRLHANLGDAFQEQVDSVTEDAKGVALTTENAIVWTETSRGKKRGMGVEMVFRDGKGNIVAMLRHLERESSPEAASEEVVEALVDFIEEN
jgi:serine/threonine protein kinase